MAVSGTTSTTVFRTQRVIDEAIRNCRLTPQQITSEIQEEAKNKLYLLLSSLAADGITLWCIEKKILPMYQGNPNVTLPLGTSMLLNANLRTLQRLTAGEATSSEGVADNAFDQDLSTACTQTTPNGYIEYAFDADTSFSSLGLLPNASGTWNFTIQTSTDGIDYDTVYTATDYVAVAGKWLWVDVIEPDSTIESAALNDIIFVKLVASGGTILDVTEFVIANMPMEITMAPINRDDYMNLPNKAFQGRPVEYWLDMQRDVPIMRIWPAPNLAAVFQQITMFTQRYIMDVGALTDTLDLPQRWFQAIVDQLAWKLAKSRKEVDLNLIPVLKDDAEQSLRKAWNGETDSGPVYLRPNISCYTR